MKNQFLAQLLGKFQGKLPNAYRLFIIVAIVELSIPFNAIAVMVAVMSANSFPY